MASIKTSVSLRETTLSKLRGEARRQRRSVSGMINLWIDEELATLAQERKRTGRDGERKQSAVAA